MNKIFKKIFNISKADLETEICRRMTERFTPMDTCPLVCQLSFNEKLVAGKLLNISAGGIMYETTATPPFKTDDKVSLHLEIDHIKLDIIADVKSIIDNNKSGLAVVFEDPIALANYRQITIPIIVGGSLKEIDPSKVMQAEPGLIKKIFTGLYGASLTIWIEDASDGAMKSFEFHMEHNTVLGNSRHMSLEVLNPQDNDEASEFKQYFCWVVPNLTENIPKTAREFLAKFTK